jgi:alpha-tubulin suppressor-like RCC1 family protein
MADGGYSHSCLLDDNTGVKCTGLDNNGVQGNGAGYTAAVTFTAVPGLSGVSSIAMGDGHACAMLMDTTVQCWGTGTDGQLGTGATGDQSEPVAGIELNAGSGNAQLMAGPYYTYVGIDLI